MKPLPGKSPLRVASNETVLFVMIVVSLAMGRVIVTVCAIIFADAVTAIKSTRKNIFRWHIPFISAIDCGSSQVRITADRKVIDRN